jgi:hypothetical protein
MTTPRQTPHPLETQPPIRLDELPGLTDAQRAEALAKLAAGETLHVVDPITRQARRVVA